MSNSFICFFCPAEAGETVTLSCLHKYHKSCVKKWLKTENYCPLCRYLKNNVLPGCNSFILGLIPVKKSLLKRKVMKKKGNGSLW